MAYEAKFKSDTVEAFFDAVLALRDYDDCYRFFEDICTINEINTISQRLEVARLLMQKKTYNDIEAITKASTATISRVNKCITYGADGYRRILERLEDNDGDINHAKDAL
jgi:TrpR-related protein YerC/YecD